MAKLNNTTNTICTHTLSLHVTANNNESKGIEKEIFIKINNNGIIIVKCFNRLANAIFGKGQRIASEEVVLQLLNSKCRPIPALRYSATRVIHSQYFNLAVC